MGGGGGEGGEGGEGASDGGGGGEGGGVGTKQRGAGHIAVTLDVGASWTQPLF